MAAFTRSDKRVKDRVTNVLDLQPDFKVRLRLMIRHSGQVIE